MQRVPGYPQTPAHKDAQRGLAVHRWGGFPGTCTSEEGRTVVLRQGGHDIREA
jgi:hypothetical protein